MQWIYFFSKQNIFQGNRLLNGDISGDFQIMWALVVLPPWSNRTKAAVLWEGKKTLSSERNLQSAFEWTFNTLLRFVP